MFGLKVKGHGGASFSPSLTLNDPDHVALQTQWSTDQWNTCTDNQIIINK